METRDEFIPFSAVHPGEILGEELKERGIKQKDFAAQIGMQPTHLNSLIKGKMDMSEKIAYRLEDALGISFVTWMNMQTNYVYYSAKIKERGEQEAAALHEEMMYDALLNMKAIYKYLGIGFVDAKRRLAALSDACLNPELATTLSVGYYKKSEKCQVDERNLRTWLYLVASEASKRCAVRPYVNGNAVAAAEKIAKYANKGELSIEKVTGILDDSGIVYIHVPKLDKVPVDAYSSMIDGKYVIAATYRHNDVDKLAFDIIHELGHVNMHIKSDGDSFISMDDCVKDKREQEADRFASDTLIHPEVWRRIMSVGSKSLSVYSVIDKIAKSAAANGISPTIAVSRYKHESNRYNIAKYRSAKFM